MSIKRYNPKLDNDTFGYPFIRMEESASGKYVLAEEFFENNPNYYWSYKNGEWMHKGEE